MNMFENNAIRSYWDGTSKKQWFTLFTAAHAGIALRAAAPFYYRSINNNAHISFLDSVFMGGGTEYSDVLRFMSSNVSFRGRTLFTLHNLAGEFNSINGYIGHVDGRGTENITINFIGDDRLLQSFNANVRYIAPFEASVSGVETLKIEAVFPNLQDNRTDYAIQAFIE
jgi:hypothetical protein